jgi:hypothetical protein
LILHVVLQTTQIRVTQPLPRHYPFALAAATQKSDANACSNRDDRASFSAVGVALSGEDLVCRTARLNGHAVVTFVSPALFFF